MTKTKCALVVTALGAMALALPVRAAGPPDSPISGLVNVYQKVADTILAANDSETTVVHAILEVERDTAVAALDRAAGSTGTPADLRTAAAHIGDFATEGGSIIEPIRNRLLTGGHHHNADDVGLAAAYDTGYVIVTKKQKQEVLDLAKRCAKAAEASKVDATEAVAIRDALKALAAKVLAIK